MSIIIAITILLSTWSLLKQSIKLSLDGVPEGINLDTVQSTIKNKEGVIDFHHIHIWAISTTQNALTGHLVVANNASNDFINAIKSDIKHSLEHLNIQHSTLEIEFESNYCAEQNC